MGGDSVSRSDCIADAEGDEDGGRGRSRNRGAILPLPNSFEVSPFERNHTNFPVKQKSRAFEWRTFRGLRIIIENEVFPNHSPAGPVGSDFTQSPIKISGALPDINKLERIKIIRQCVINIPNTLLHKS